MTYTLEFLLENPRYLIAALVFVVGSVIGYLVGKLNKYLLVTVGLDEAVDGTELENTLQRFNITTVSLLARLSAWLIYGVMAIVALHIIAGGFDPRLIWSKILRFLPQIFIATVVVITSLVMGDKLKLILDDHLQNLKFPQTAFLPEVAKYSVFYVGSLIALAQIGVQTAALLVLLVVYVFAFILFGAIALKGLLASGAAGVYIVLMEPYTIGDTVTLAGKQGVVQEIDLVTTTIETGAGDYVIPNKVVLNDGVLRASS